jgi:diguanylate cyclase (GGDEF)-like protein
MIDTKEKQHLIYKIVFIMFVSLVLISCIRVLVFHNDLISINDLYTLVAKELLFSILSACFIVMILYVFIQKEISHVNKKAINYAFKDALTGLYNRRYLDDFIKKFVSLNKEDTNFAIVFIDIDRFKKVNDELGHSAGDCILKRLAVNFKSSIRPDDLLCRYGGEEFIIIFTDILKQDVIKKVEHIRSNIENRIFECDKQKITISIGISFGKKNDDIYKVIEESDKALYMAKEAGRNCIKVFSS